MFTEVARMAYEVDDMNDFRYLMHDLPYQIIPGEERSLRSSIFLERAIVSERIRLAMGLSLRPIDESVSASEGLEESVIAEKYYEPPLINVIKFACNRCEEKNHQGHRPVPGLPCAPLPGSLPQEGHQLPQRQEPYRPEPCASSAAAALRSARTTPSCVWNVPAPRPAAWMRSIPTNYGRAEIDYSKCVSCGMCLVNCPFGAIADKGQIFQLIRSIKRGDRVIAIVAPAFVNQFPGMTPAKLREAMKLLGFAGISEVAIGADLCTIDEAKDFMKEVPEKLPFMGTSLLPGVERDGQEAVPRLCRVHQHDHDPDGADRPPDQERG